jgi:hypothetical protein
MEIKLIEDGNFARWIRVGFFLTGVMVIILSIDVKMFWSWARIALFCVGFVFAGIGGYTSQAHALRIKPFGNKNRARKTHAANDDGDSAQH